MVGRKTICCRKIVGSCASIAINLTSIVASRATHGHVASRPLTLALASKPPLVGRKHKALAALALIADSIRRESGPVASET